MLNFSQRATALVPLFLPAFLAVGLACMCGAGCSGSSSIMPPGDGGSSGGGNGGSVVGMPDAGTDATMVTSA